MVKILKTFLFITILISIIFSQVASDIQSKRAELNKLRQEIEQLDRKLKETLSKEKQNLNLIDGYDQQLRLIKSLIKKLEEEEEKLNYQIKQKENEIRIAENELNDLLSEYEKNLVNFYKYGRKNPLELLLTSKSVNQALLRYKYLEKFTEDRKRRIELINKKTKEIENERKNLLSVLNEKEALKKEKTTEENQLNKKITEKRNFVSSLRKDKELLIKDIERKKQSAKKIAELIDQLIEQKRREELAIRQRELERKKRLQEKLTERKTSETSTNSKQTRNENLSDSDYQRIFDQNLKFSSFSQMRGKLPWPVNGKIVNRFGEQKNPYLNTVTLNFGVDIATPYGSPVRSIADGKVSIVHWLPGYGNIVIITHSEEYRTVYAYLSEVIVQEGQIVKRGDIIAKSGESLTGEMVHLEIWKEREKQNPEHWLANR